MAASRERPRRSAPDLGADLLGARESATPGRPSMSIDQSRIPALLGRRQQQASMILAGPELREAAGRTGPRDVSCQLPAL